MTFAQINLKGKTFPGISEPLTQTNVVFRLDKVLDISTNSTFSDQFLIQLQDGGEACTSSVVLGFGYPGGEEPPAITTDQVAAINNNLVSIMNSALTGSYTDAIIDITDTILKGVVSSEGKQPFITSVNVASTQPSFS